MAKLRQTESGVANLRVVTCFNSMFQRDTDPAHWKLVIFYYNPDEPKLFVPKRTGIPFTLNFAKPAAWAITLTTIALIAFVFTVNNRF
jgi:uncharacterized membrane protein